MGGLPESIRVRHPSTEWTAVKKKMCLVQAIFFTRKRKKHGKNQKVVSVQKWGCERRGEGSYGVQIQEGQELTDVAASAPLTTQKSSESHIVDVTNKNMVNRQQDFMLDMHVRVGM
jgi:hypothetical protein